jgi:hypothetical protein
MKKQQLAISLFAILLTSLACTIGYEGVSIGSDPDIEFIEDQTATAASAQTALPQQAAATTAAEYQPAVPQSSNAQAVNAGSHEYSVDATDFDCICQVDGNSTASFNFTGNQLEFTNPGGVVDIYDKISENQYQRTFMGYYILVNGEGAQATETVVEEEKRTVIVLKDSGFVMEHYSGSSDSPCCYHTFTMTK